MIINTNIAAINANRFIKSNSEQSQKAMGKLSSGKKINSASDNAAGLAISEKMKSQIRGLEQATINTEQGIDLIKTSDGAMGEIHSSLQRMRELSVQASNETNTDQDRKAIQMEMNQLSKQIDSISKTTEFNTIKTVDGYLRNLPPTNAVETGKSVLTPISIHDDTPAIIRSNSDINFSSGVEIHEGKQAVTDLNLNSPINISSPNNNLSITYLDENSIQHTGDLYLADMSNGTVQDLAKSIRDAISSNTRLQGKIKVDYSTNPDKVILTSDILKPNEPNVNVGIHINNSLNSAVNTLIGTPSIMTGILKDPITISKGDSLNLTYTDSNGISTSKTLTFDSDSGPYNSLALKKDLADLIQRKIPAPLDTKISVSIDDSGKLKLQSKDLGYNANVNIVSSNSDASAKIFSSINPQSGGINQNFKPGVTRNDQLRFTLNDKITAASTKFDENNGFTISDSQWISKTFDITIPPGTYNSVSKLSSAINSEIERGKYDDKVNVSFDSTDGKIGKLKFTTINEGKKASLQLEDIKSGKGSNMFNILSLNSNTSVGKDKTDTFAIEVNAEYTEKELNDEDLSLEDIEKLLRNETIYTPNGYIIQDPLNPCDFIEYTKIQGSGEIQQITLESKDYKDKYEFAKALENAINDSTKQLGNDVTVTVDSTGGFSISTPEKNGARSSIRFVVPSNSNIPGNQSPINTSMDELLNNFLNETGFDYNRHVGKDGTGKMDIQVGANSNQSVLVTIGSVRSGALGIKYLDISTSEKASDAISIIDKAINKVSSERTNLGAFQNRFEHTISNQQNAASNLTSAQSGIEDADMAKEMAEVSKNQILIQSAQAMLVKANEEPKHILDLLR